MGSKGFGLKTFDVAHIDQLVTKFHSTIFVHLRREVHTCPKFHLTAADHSLQYQHHKEIRHDIYDIDVYRRLFVITLIN
jgi:hypothetical protein